jgi:hypothetical protein
LPTELGKTETMLTTQVYRRLDRSPVFVSSGALRRQMPRNRRNLGTDGTSTDHVAHTEPWR